MAKRRQGRAFWARLISEFESNGWQREARRLRRSRRPAGARVPRAWRTRAACLAHAGRHLFEALATAPEVRHALDLIRDVYVVEHEATLQNNIVDAQSGNGVLTTGGGIAYQNNLYFGSTIQVPAGDTHPITADPKLASPGTGQSGSASGPAFGSLTGYQLQTGSPAINGGVNIANNGGLDVWGTALPTSTPDVGAYQAP